MSYFPENSPIFSPRIPDGILGIELEEVVAFYQEAYGIEMTNDPTHLSHLPPDPWQPIPSTMDYGSHIGLWSIWFTHGGAHRVDLMRDRILTPVLEANPA